MTQYLLAGDGRRLTTGGGVPLTADAPGDAGTPIVASAMPVTMTGSATVSALASVSASLAMTFALVASPSIRGGVAPMDATFAMSASPSATGNAQASASMAFGLSASPTAAADVDAAPMSASWTLAAQPSAATTAAVVPAAMPAAFHLSAGPSQSATLGPVALATAFGLTARPSLDYGDLLRPPRPPRPVLLLTIGAEPLPVVTPIIPVTSTPTVDGHVAAPLAPPTGLSVVATVDAAQLEWVGNGVADSEYVIEDAPDSAGTPGTFGERAATSNLRYTLAVAGTRWIRVRARLNGRLSAPTTPVLVTRIDSGQITVSATKISQVEAKLDAKTTTFAQGTPPPSTGRVVGDTWINTADSNKIYTWAGSNWALRELPAGIKTFYQPSPPTAQAVGDLWYDSDDNNKQYRWSGSAWVLVEDARIAASASAVQMLDARVTTTEAGVTSYRASYTLTLDAGGKISGFKSVNDGATSVFEVAADVFRITAGSTGLTLDSSRMDRKFGSMAAYEGDPFGADSLVMWIGPASIAKSAATKANGTFWISASGTTGGGSMIPTSGSVIYKTASSASQSAISATTASMSRTAGKAREIIATMATPGANGIRFANNGSGTTQFSVPFVVEVSRDGGAWTQVGSSGFCSGSITRDNSEPGSTSYSGGGSGSITVYDEVSSGSSLQYRVREAGILPAITGWGSALAHDVSVRVSEVSA